MRIIKRYEDFLKFKMNEAFDLNSFIVKEKLQPDLVEIATNVINQWYEEAGVNIPNDIKNKKENLILWFARGLRKSAIFLLNRRKNLPTNASRLTQKLFNKDSEETSDEEIQVAIKRISNGEPVDIFETTYSNFTTSLLTSIQDYIFSMNRNTQVYKVNFMSTLEEMIETSKVWHESLKASGSVKTEEGYILKKYDDGFYWVDLLTNNSREEADAMGHCGRTSHDTIVSLRKVINGKIEPCVTLALDYEPDLDAQQRIDDSDTLEYITMYQCKGRGNKKPAEKYHKYIIDFLLDDNINIQEIGEEYSPSEDFQLSDIKDMDTLDKFLDKKPGLFFSEGVKLMGFIDNIPLIKKLYDISQKSDMLNLDTRDFNNMYVLWKLDILSFDAFKDRFTNLDSVKDGVIYMKTEAESLTEFSVLYSDDEVQRNSKSYAECVEKSDEQPTENNGSAGVDTILRSHEIDYENLSFIYERTKDEYLDDDCSLDYFIDHYAQIIGHGGSFDDDIVSAIEDAYDRAQNIADDVEAWHTMYQPLKDFCGLGDDEVNFSIMPLKEEYLKYLDDEESYNIRNDANAITLYDNIFTVSNISYDKDIKFKFEYPYYGWSGDVTDDILNNELAEIFNNM